MHFMDGKKKLRSMLLERMILMKDIKGFEGLYAVTSCGRVWSYKSNKFLNPNVHRNGYTSVCLYKDRKQHRVLVHRLIAEAFIPNPDNLPEVNHLDENKEHNWINNLEWSTVKYNRNYGTRNARSGENHRIKVMCVETKEVFDSLTDCERKTGCDRSHISKQMRGIIKHVKGLHFIKV